MTALLYIIKSFSAFIDHARQSPPMCQKGMSTSASLFSSLVAPAHVCGGSSKHVNSPRVLCEVRRLICFKLFQHESRLKVINMLPQVDERLWFGKKEGLLRRFKKNRKQRKKGQNWEKKRVFLKALGWPIRTRKKGEIVRFILSFNWSLPRMKKKGKRESFLGGFSGERRKLDC